jgi:hypothetical protein
MSGYCKRDAFPSRASEDVSDADINIKNLLENNRKWVAATNAANPEFFSGLAKGQKPKYLYFGYSASSTVNINITCS